jgi:hypothetical protein
VNLSRGASLVEPAKLHGLVPYQKREHGTGHQRDEEGDSEGDHVAGAESGMMQPGARIRRFRRLFGPPEPKFSREAIDCRSKPYPTYRKRHGGCEPSASFFADCLGVAIR